MTQTAEAKTKNARDEGRPCGPFSEIDHPGTYYSHWSGHLIRVTEEGVRPGHSPVIEILGKNPMIVTRLSDDPYLGISKARMIAADLDLAVNF